MLRPRVRLAAAALCSGLFACAASPAPAPSSTPEVAAAPAAAPAEPTKSLVGGEGLAEARAQEITAEIVAQVSEVRGLPITRPFEVVVRDRAQLKAFAQASMHEHYSDAEIKLFGRIDASLGIIPPGADIERLLLGLLEQSVMGIYDPKARALLIGAHVTESMLPMVSGHEIAHGLQDMHFDLKSMQQPLRGQSDRETARTFLVEGDAQAAYLAWRAGEYGLEGLPDAVLTAMSDQALALSDALENPIMARGLQLPYTAGTTTVIQLARARGWPAVDALYGDLPTTSEQMLHLDKLLAREPAIPVSIDAAALTAALPEFAAIWEDTIGEATLLAMLADVASPAIARDSAAGWGGDRYVVLDKIAHPAVVPLVVGAIAWDSEADARAFEEPFSRYLKGRMPGSFTLERRGAIVLYTTRVPDAKTQAALREIVWRSVRVGGTTGKESARPRGAPARHG